MTTPFVDQIQQLYEAQHQQLYTYALSLTHNRELAEDAIHNAFTSILRRGKAPRELRPYIFRCVRNAALDALKASSNGHIESSLFADKTTLDPAVTILAEEALANLAGHERETVVMKIYGGLTLKEIAKTHRVSINTAASRYRRGLERLRTFLEEAPDEKN